MEKSGGHFGRSTAVGVWMVLWKLERSGEFRKMPHKVGSQKSPGRGGLLRTSAGVILYPTPPIKLDDNGSNSLNDHWRCHTSGAHLAVRIIIHNMLI